MSTDDSLKELSVKVIHIKGNQKSRMFELASLDLFRNQFVWSVFSSGGSVLETYGNL